MGPRRQSRHQEMERKDELCDCDLQRERRRRQDHDDAFPGRRACRDGLQGPPDGSRPTGEFDAGAGCGTGVRGHHVKPHPDRVAPLSDAILRTDIENLELIPSHASIEAAEQFLPVRSHYTLGIRRALEAAAPLSYDFVLMDCPPFLGAITTNALSAADLAIIPTQAEYFSAYALRNMMGMIRRVRQESNAGLGYRILITLLDRRNRTHRSIQEQLQLTFGEGLFRTIIEIDTKLRESPIAGVPITRYRPGTRGSQQYRELAQELTEYVQQRTQQAA